MPDLLDAIRQRHACRTFARDRAVSAEQLELLLEAGRLAPSAFGLEPWRFVTVTGPAAKAALARACFDQPAARSAAAFIVIAALVDALVPESDYVRARFEAEARGDDAAPIHAAYRGHYRRGTIAGWAQGQCNFAAAQMLLQATHMGLGSCPLGGFDASALGEVAQLRHGEIPALAIALGYCAHAAPPRIRKPVDE